MISDRYVSILKKKEYVQQDLNPRHFLASLLFYQWATVLNLCTRNYAWLVIWIKLLKGERKNKKKSQVPETYRIASIVLLTKKYPKPRNLHPSTYAYVWSTQVIGGLYRQKMYCVRKCTSYIYTYRHFFVFVGSPNDLIFWYVI